MFSVFPCKVWRGVRLGPDGEPMSKEGYVLKRMLLEKGNHVMQAGIRSGLVMDPSRRLAKRKRGRCWGAFWVRFCGFGW